MKKNIIIDEQAICDDYVNGRLGTEGLASKYHIGKVKVREILKRNDITPKKRGGQSLNINYVVNDWKIKKYPEVEGKHYIAVDKLNGFTTTDIDNKAGVLTTHIEKTYNVKTPTLYDRRMYYMQTGNYWWEQWFDIELVDNNETKKCPYCDWETADIHNKSGMFITHLKKVHNISKFEHLENHPEDRQYLSCANKRIDRQMEKNPDKFVVCKVCGEKFARIDMHHLRTHGLTKLQYIRLYGNEEMSSKEYHTKQGAASIQTNMNMTFTKNSKSENEIKDFIIKSGFDCKSDRHILNGKEIDIYIPSLKTGIEYNGNLWHTEWFGKKDSSYHVSKMDACKKQGVKLITIFEDEYELHKELVLGKIAHILKINRQTLGKIYGRKCIIEKIYSYQAKEFLEKNHIQGHVNSTIFLGAFNNDKLVGVMSFLDNKNGEWELTRFATDNNYICSGIGGKLFSYFINHYEYREIKSFADRRWTLDENDNIYTKLGFTLDGIVRPNYTYYNPSIDRFKRFHKFKFRKEKLLREYPFLNPAMTESEMVKELGYDRIWDCGLIRYVYKNTNL